MFKRSWAQWFPPAILPAWEDYGSKPSQAKMFGRPHLNHGWAWWHAPVIPATWEAEILIQKGLGGAGMAHART
jgi:hypothetical protein